jgi:hypothetical protein
MAKASKWIPVFKQFAKDVRISSKEESSEDDYGIPLVMWGSQERFLEFIGNGLDDGIHQFFWLKGRQQGSTTICLLIDTFWAAFHRNLFGALITDNEDNRERNRSIITRYVKSFPEGYFGDDFYITKNNRNFIEFSNGSRFDLKIAGTKQKSIAWAEGAGYVMAHATEVGKYGDGDGIESFMEAMPQHNPNRLLICESTANRMNHWYDMWRGADNDPYTKRSGFCGWWGVETNVIQKSDPRWLKYGGYSAAGEEREKVAAVAQLYNHKVTPEQLAWIRWRRDTSTDAEGIIAQNQPWTAQDAFISSGYSFFMTRNVVKEIQRLFDLPPVSVQDGGNGYQAYVYDLSNRFFDMKIRPLMDDDGDVAPELKVWEEPVAAGRYVIGFDPAWGRTDHGDFSAISVWRCFSDKLVQVAEYCTKSVELKQVCWVLAHLAGSYDDCLSADSEILTRSGWRAHDQIAVGDEVVGFDVSSGSYQWESIGRIVIRDHHGDMYRIQSDGLDCLVTPNHRVISQRDSPRQGNHWQVKTATEMAAGSDHIRYIPKGGCPFGPGIPDLSLDMCRALGWIITDGHRRKYEITLVQAKKTKKNNIVIYNAIDEVLSRLCEFSRYDHKGTERRGEWVSWVIRKGSKIEFDKWLCPEDIHRIPRHLIDNMSEAQTSAIFQGLMEGDGNWDPACQLYRTFCPGHARELADGFQEIALKLGYSTSIKERRTIGPGGIPGNSQIVVNISTRSGHTFRGLKTESYSGKVWCVSVPSGAFVMRRNGKVSVTGNCIVNIDLNGPGRVVMMEWDNIRAQLNTEMYEKVVRHKDWQAAMHNARWYIYSRPDTMGKGFAYNFDSSAKQKQELMHGMRGAHITDQLIIRSVPLLKEMLIVVADGNVIGAPESSSEASKDDRVYAAALSIRAWSNWRQPEMLAQGLNFATVTDEESGKASRESVMMNQIVRRFLLNAEEKAQLPPEVPYWRRDLGLE